MKSISTKGMIREALIDGAAILIGLIVIVVAITSGSENVRGLVAIGLMGPFFIAYGVYQYWQANKWRRTPHFKDHKYDHTHIVHFGDGSAVTSDMAREETERHLREGNPDEDDPCNAAENQTRRLKAITGGVTHWMSSPLFRPIQKGETEPMRVNGYTLLGSQEYWLVVEGYLSSKEEGSGDPRQVYPLKRTAWAHEVDHESFGSHRGHAHEYKDEKSRIKAWMDRIKAGGTCQATELPKAIVIKGG